MSFNVKQIVPHILMILFLVLTVVIYFLPQTQGKVLNQSDLVQYKGMSAELNDYRKKGDEVLWINNMFGGMPAYQVGTKQKNNLTRHIERVTQLFTARPIGYFISAAIVFYLSMLVLGVSGWIALLGAIAFAFSTNMILLYEAGHTSKFRALVMCVPILVGAITILQKKYLIGGITFSLGMTLSIYANHFQMNYYLGLVLMLLVIIYSIYYLLQGKARILAYALGIMGISTLLGIGASASKFLTTYEYSKETIRGKSILESDSKTNSTAKSEEREKQWNYAMGWSNGMRDVVASVIPGYAGGGSSEPLSKSSATNTFLRKNGARAIPYGPLYHGDLPFTSGPVYLGIIVFFLFVLSSFTIKGPLKWWALAGVLFTILLSMGKNLEWLNRLMFDYFPFYDKFRTPNSIGGITQMTMLVFALFGLHQIFTKKEAIKPMTILYTMGGVVGFLLLCLLLGWSGDFLSPNDVNYAKQIDVSVFVEDRKSLFFSDTFRSIILTVLAGGLIYAYKINKFKAYIAFIGLTILMLFDFINIDTRYLNGDSFQNKRKVKNTYVERPVDKQIKQDPDPHYRVYDLTKGDPFKSAWTSYFHKSIGGYHAAKLQRSRDINQQSIGLGEQHFLDLLNAKYFIVSGQNGEQVVKNPNARGNAWFVENIRFVSSNLEEFRTVKDINTATTAVVHSEFKNDVKEKYDGNGTIVLKSYHPEKLTYTSSSASEGLAIFSEMWYGPDLGWKLFVDGKETPLIRSNYALRAAVIPAGEHTLEMKFHPNTYYLGETISLIASLLIYLVIGYAVYYYFFRKGIFSIKNYYCKTF